MTHTLQDFFSIVRDLSEADLSGSATLNSKLRIAQSGEVEVIYAPFEFINPQARIILVGITPGQTQMLNALRECRHQLRSGANVQQALKAAKQTGAFSGAMRPNLIALMDCVGLNRWLNLPSCEALFGSSAHLIQSTSVLRNPVFVSGKNYNGTPNMTRTPVLRQQLLDGFAQDVKALPKALLIPLGDKVSEALHFLATEGVIDRQHILDGLPHPSGANAERIAYFLGRKERSTLSVKTSPDKLDAAKAQLINKIKAL